MLAQDRITRDQRKLAARLGADRLERSVSPGVVTHRRHTLDPGLDYYLYVPEDHHPDAPILVSVHGISRNAHEHAEALASQAERHGVVLIAPHFSRPRFPDYQRLGRRGHGVRADIALDAIVAEVVALTGARGDRFFLTGYSGGAQFAHRYAFAYPRRVAALAVCAAGWYTFPDPDLVYPHGLRLGGRLPGVAFNPAAILRLPAVAFVGARDTARDPALNTADGIDRRQGRTRLARARNWIAAMTEAARARGLDTGYDFELLPRTGHSFHAGVAPNRGDLARRLFERMFTT